MEAHPIRQPRLTDAALIRMVPPFPMPFGDTGPAVAPAFFGGAKAMKVVNSLKSAKKRDKNCRVVRRKGRVYVINKSNPRFKARQG